MHKKISFWKSIIRIAGSIITIPLLFINIYAALVILALSYGVAEGLGILEEKYENK